MENLMVGSHKSQNFAWDDGFDKITWDHTLRYEDDTLRYEHSLLYSDGDFEAVSGVMKSLGFDLDRNIDSHMSEDGKSIIYTQDK
jgi:hypothetical protein